MTADPRIVLVAGGTGGHVFPARSLAVELQTRGHVLAFITDRRGEGYGETVIRLDTYRLRAGTPSGKGLLGRIKAFYELGAGWWQARRLLRELTPAAVVGFGGYPALPTMIAALQAGIPTVIHEQNAVLGRVNRSLQAHVDAIALTFADTAGLEPANAAKTVVTGNPVRPDLVPLRAAPYPRPTADGELRLLVLGGSQGAKALSDTIPAALARLPIDLRRRLRVSAQCRREDLDAARAAYAQAEVQAICAPFFVDVAQELAKAHVAIARAGASTVTEIAAIGRPAILVPYPHATDDHQTANARALATAGGAKVFQQSAFTAEALAATLGDWLTDTALLAAMAERSRAAGVPDAARRLADLVERVAPRSGAKSRARDLPAGAAGEATA
ncbi:MAG: undecaprenyldiphospho-muramoylpentapeptide beta-N-acetylglucosaminyltransferase [Alphaproteobacteria bacterium]|nr:undecaprenyldiphospho-muramoylpentapeptide beta-N-acetylglucosaminyltransferase [Alphaproteobacteria bacterium]